jgi:hypothetical protein
MADYYDWPKVSGLADAETLVAEGKARWFRSAESARNFASQSGGQYFGEITSRVSIGRYLALTRPGAEEAANGSVG